MKLLKLKSFEVDAVKSEISQKIKGGDGEGSNTDTCKGTTKTIITTDPFRPTVNTPDSSPDGDWYASC